MLSTCSHNGFGTHNCGHSEDVALSCSSSESIGKCTLCNNNNDMYNGKFSRGSIFTDAHYRAITSTYKCAYFVGLIFAVLFAKP